MSETELKEKEIMSMKRKKSILWNYFQPTVNDKAACNLCQHHLSYKTSTTNLKKHIERRHPTLLALINKQTSGCVEGEFLKLENSNIEMEEYFDDEESIFLEYSDDIGNQEKRIRTQNEIPQATEILRIPISRDVDPIRIGKTQLEKTENAQMDKIRKEELKSKFSNLANSRNELIKIELEAAKKDLELKEWQLICAKKEEKRRQEVHEISMRIKRAQLEAILNHQKIVSESVER